MLTVCARRVLTLLFALTALLLAGCVGLVSVPAAHASGAQNRVRGFTAAAHPLAGGQATGSACVRPDLAISGGQLVAGFCVAAEGGQLLLGPGTTIGEHVAGDLAKRGWTERLVQSTIDNPASTVATRDVRYLRGGGRMDDPATGYISQRGGYVVRNDRTGDVVQISDRTDPGWLAPWDR